MNASQKGATSASKLGAATTEAISRFVIASAFTTALYPPSFACKCAFAPTTPSIVHT